MLAAVTQMEMLTAAINRLSIDGFTPAELLDLQQRREALTRAQPVVDHRIYQRLRTETTPTALGAPSFAKVLVQRLRISETEAPRLEFLSRQWFRPGRREKRRVVLESLTDSWCYLLTDR